MAVKMGIDKNSGYNLLDPLWEFVLDDYGTDGSDTVPTIESTDQSTAERWKWKMVEANRAAAQVTSKSQQKLWRDARDEDKSKRKTWQKMKETEEREDSNVTRRGAEDDFKREKALWKGISKKPFQKKAMTNLEIQSTTLKKANPTRQSGQKSQQRHGQNSERPRSSLSSSKTKPIETKESAENQKDDDFYPITMIRSAISTFDEVDPFGIRAFEDPPMRVTPAALSDSTSSSDGSSYTFETSYTNASREYQSRPKARSTVRKLSEQEKKEIRLKFRPTSDSGVEIESQKDISRGTTRFEKRLLNGEANITKASLNRKNILRSPFSSGESTMKKQYSGENDGVLNKATSKKQENSAVQRSNKEEANSQSQETSIVQRSITDIACFSKAYHLDKNVGHWKPIIKASPPVDLYPMVRMVSDFDDVQIPIGWQADLINGIFGVPSDKFLETKGPQSLYCYEYASNSNIDVSYSKFGDVLTSFLGIRRLDHPPLLKSDNSNNILVRVEVSEIVKHCLSNCLCMRLMSGFVVAWNRHRPSQKRTALFAKAIGGVKANQNSQLPLV
jgi:hypothetical protein